jgi:hypothetical protein
MLIEINLSVSHGATLMLPADERMRDRCILADEVARTCYLIDSVARHGSCGRPAVVAIVSRDLETRQGPHVILEIPPISRHSGAFGRRKCVSTKENPDAIHESSV